MRSPALILCACLFAGIAAPALAECPVASDMARGVMLTLADGGTELHREIGPDLVQINVTFADEDGDGSVMTFGHGIYLRTSVPVEKGVMKIAETENFITNNDILTWYAPLPDRTWKNPGPNGAVVRTGKVTSVSLGECRYTAIPTRVFFHDAPKFVEVYDFLPALGIGLLVETVDDGKKETFDYVSIAKN